MWLVGGLTCASSNNQDMLVRELVGVLDLVRHCLFLSFSFQAGYVKELLCLIDILVII